MDTAVLVVIMVTLLMILIAVVSGIVVALLERLDGASAPQLVLRGLKAFGAALGVQLGVATFMGGWVWHLFF
ncbi:hypothetical protein OHO28_51400 [Streptomyces europaeiscabiei]|uniref:hypothetical protein n=1 Tax=Streptomyces europaeiscabiei TaxID=146819 RepID=UPI002E1924AA